MIKPGGRGKSFEALITYSFNSSEHAYVVRLRESIKVARCHKCQSFINLANKSRKQPFDYVVIYKGRPFAFEAKSVHSLSFPFRNIKEHQIYELTRFEKDGSSHVVIEFIPGRPKERRCFMVPIGVFNEWITFYSDPAHERKSVPLSKFEEEVQAGRVFEIAYGKNDKNKKVLEINVELEKVLSQRW